MIFLVLPYVIGWFVYAHMMVLTGYMIGRLRAQGALASMDWSERVFACLVWPLTWAILFPLVAAVQTLRLGEGRK